MDKKMSVDGNRQCIVLLNAEGRQYMTYKLNILHEFKKNHRSSFQMETLLM
jgi:hypothetical protein